MIISLRPTEESVDALGEVFSKLIVLPGNFMDEAMPICAKHWELVITNIFNREGQSGQDWEPLAELTQDEREELFGPEHKAHPILRRPGEGYLFRSLWDDSLMPGTVNIKVGGAPAFVIEDWETEPHQSGHVKEIDSDGEGHITFRMGSMDDRFEDLFEHRKFVPVGSNQTTVCMELEDQFIPVIVNLTRPQNG